MKYRAEIKENKMKKICTLLVFALFAGVSAMVFDTVATAYQNNSGYTNGWHGDGPDAIVFENGGSLTMKSGSTLTAASGATVSMASATVSGSISAASVTSTSVSAGSVSATAGPITVYGRTLAQLQAITPTAKGQIYLCSDCSVSGSIAISTGTGIGQFGILTPGALE